MATRTFKRKFARKKGPSSTEMSLNITSMADIFTILLVFLLKSYAVGALEVQPSRGLKVPVAIHSDTAEDRLKVEIAETSVQVDGDSVVTLKDFEPAQGSEAMGPLAQALVDKRASLAESSQGKLLVIADSRAPYSTLERVLKTAAQQGFGDLKLAVVRAD